MADRYPEDNSVASYGSIAQLFHWLVAVLVFVQIAIGLYVEDLPVGLERLQWLSRHKSLGFVILVLVLLRLAWRLFHPAPALPDNISTLTRRFAAGTHALLYGLLIAAPLAGWLHASASGLGVSVFGWFVLPDMVAKNAALSEWFHELHVVLVLMLAVVAAVHIAAALRHALILHDGIMLRMLPRTKDRRKST